MMVTVHMTLLSVIILDLVVGRHKKITLLKSNDSSYRLKDCVRTQERQLIQAARICLNMDKCAGIRRESNSKPIKVCERTKIKTYENGTIQERDENKFDIWIE